MFSPAFGSRPGGAEKVLSTGGNFNNLVGVPATIFRANSRVRHLILELGANAFGEIERLAGICEPDVGAVTKVERAHLAGFGNLEGVARAKTELFRVMPRKSVFVFNAGDPFLAPYREFLGEKTVTFRDLRGGGKTSGEDLELVREESRDGIARELFFAGKTVGASVLRVKTALVGSHHAENVLVALAMAVASGISPGTAAAAMAAAPAPEGRGTVRDYR
ncbi:MAG: hypothetical protein LBF41_05955, partial [Deltaproteobacteria bacterium]|nr:hypothetical protein [Deltaproteobacteria bacterium]